MWHTASKRSPMSCTTWLGIRSHWICVRAGHLFWKWDKGEFSSGELPRLIAHARFSWRLAQFSFLGEFVLKYPQNIQIIAFVSVDSEQHILLLHNASWTRLLTWSSGHLMSIWRKNSRNRSILANTKCTSTNYSNNKIVGALFIHSLWHSPSRTSCIQHLENIIVQRWRSLFELFVYL